MTIAKSTGYTQAACEPTHVPAFGAIMTLRLATSILVLAAGLLAPGLVRAGDADDRDRIYRKNGPPMLVYIESENTNEVLYRTIKLQGGVGQTNPNKLKVQDLDHIEYSGMDSGYWSKGVEPRDGASFETAAA